METKPKDKPAVNTEKLKQSKADKKKIVEENKIVKK